MSSSTVVVTREQRREAEQEVFTLLFDRLVSAIEDNVLDIANKCLSSSLINSQTYDNVSSRSATPKERASKLLTAVRKCMRNQRNALAKFISILKEGSVHDRLIEDIERSYKEALNRKVVGKCTDKPSVKQTALTSSSISIEQQPAGPPTSLTEDANARERVFKQYLPQLESHVQGVTAAIVAEQCEAKGLISLEIYSKVKKFRKKKRAQFLLSNVQVSITADEIKFKKFVGILAKRESCKELARSMQRDVKKGNGVSEMVLSHQEQPDTTNTIMAAPNLQLRRRETSVMEANGTVPVSEDSSSDGNSNVLVDSKVVPAGKIRPKGINPLIDKTYHLKMAELQSAAQLEGLSEENAELKNSVSKLEDEIRAKDLKIETLMDEVRARDLQTEALTVEKEELQHTLECIELKFAFVEKKLHESDEKHSAALKKMITEHDKQITALQKEKDDLNKKIDSLEAARKESQDRLESLMKASQKKLDESIKELKTTSHSTSSSHKPSWPRQLTIFVVVVGIAVLLAVLAFIIWLIKHW